MGRTLYGLIRASGYSGAAGQSFRNNVAGAATGVRMSEYVLLGLVNWSSSDYSAGVDVANGGVLHFGFDFDAHPNWLNIRLPNAWDANQLYAVNTAESDPQAECLIESLSQPSGFTSGNTFIARFYGRYFAPGGAWSFSSEAARYSDFSGAYPAMEEPPDFNDYDYFVSVNFNYSGASTPPYYAENFDFVYPNDAGEFNPAFTHSIQVDVQARLLPPPSVEVQWSLDSSYTDLTAFDNSTSYNFLANKGMAPITVNYRYRFGGSGSWTVRAITAHFHN